MWSEPPPSHLSPATRTTTTHQADDDDGEDVVPSTMLLPTKVYPVTSNGSGGSGSSSNMSTTDTESMRSGAVVMKMRAYPYGPVRWTAQSVLEWIESLAAATEENEAQQKLPPPPTSGRAHWLDGAPEARSLSSRIQIDQVLLSAKSPDPTKTSVNAQEIDDPRPLDDSRGTNPPDDQGSNSAWLGKRSRSAASPGDHFTDGPAMFPRCWDLSFVERRDPFSWHHVRHMRALAFQLESFPYVPARWAHYHMAQTRLEFTLGRIMAQFPVGLSTEQGEIRHLLNVLYEETIRKLNELVNQAHGSDPSAPDLPLTPAPIISSAPSADGSASILSSSSSAGPKKDISKYMTAWLRDNWTNPYPDDEGMEELAEECGTTASVIGNWLINARTRKWRPAIIKATELNRPADLLLEDSLHIFDGHPVRPMDEAEHDRRQRKRPKLSSQASSLSGELTNQTSL